MPSLCFIFLYFKLIWKKNFFTSAQDEVLMFPAYFFHVWLNHCHFTSFKLMALFQFLLTLRFCTLMIHDLTQESKLAPLKEETERGRISNTQNNKRKHDNGTKCYMCWELWKKPCVLRLLRQQVPSECGVWVDKQAREVDHLYTHTGKEEALGLPSLLGRPCFLVTK